MHHFIIVRMVRGSLTQETIFEHDKEPVGQRQGERVLLTGNKYKGPELVGNPQNK